MLYRARSACVKVEVAALNPEEQRRRRGRSIALAVALAVLVFLFYLVTIVKLGPDVLNRPV
jgi:hypothetical protein